MLLGLVSWLDFFFPSFLYLFLERARGRSVRRVRYETDLPRTRNCRCRQALPLPLCLCSAGCLCSSTSETSLELPLTSSGFQTGRARPLCCFHSNGAVTGLSLQLEGPLPLLLPHVSSLMWSHGAGLLRLRGVFSVLFSFACWRPAPLTFFWFPECGALAVSSVEAFKP